MQKALARLALKLGGFEKVRKLTVLQARLLADVMADDQLFLAKIHGCEIKGEKKDNEEFMSFSDAFKSMQGD